MTSQVPPQEAYYYQDEIELREIIEIIRKRIWLVVLLPLVAALVAFGVSKFIVIPEYEASTKIALGTFDHPIYGNVASSREILTSNDLLSEVLEDLRIGGQYKSVEEFAKLVSVDSIRDTRMLTISYHDNDPHLAREVVQTIAGHFMERSLAAYHQRKSLLEERLKNLQINYVDAQNTYQALIDTLAALEAVEHSDAEIALARARIIDYLVKEEGSLLALSSEIHGTEVTIANLENTTVIDQPAVGIDPVNIRPMLNTAIALVLGGMVALGLVFILEYFEKNPLQPR